MYPIWFRLLRRFIYVHMHIPSAMVNHGSFTELPSNVQNPQYCQTYVQPIIYEMLASVVNSVTLLNICVTKYGLIYEILASVQIC